MKKVLILILFLLVLIGCDNKSDPKTEEIIPTEPETEEVIPTKPTKPTEPVTDTVTDIYEEETPINISLPDSKLVIDDSLDSKTYYLWTDENKLYVVENPVTLKSLNGYIKLDELAHDIDFSTSLDFGVTIDILVFIFEDLVDYLKLHSNATESGEYTFSGEELVALVKLFIPEENLSEEIIDILKEVGDNASVSIEIKDGLLKKINCKYFDNFLNVECAYMDNVISQIDAEVSFKHTINNPENDSDYLSYEIKGSCNIMISDMSLTINLDSSLKTDSNNQELCQEVQYDLLLTANENGITFNGDIYGMSFSGSLSIGENLKLDMTASYLDKSYTISFESGVEIPKTVKNDLVMAASTDIGGLYQKIIETITKKFNWEHLI